MRGICTLTILLACITLSAEAQPYPQGTFTAAAGAELLIPLRPLNQQNSTGAGGTIKGEYVFSRHTAFTLATGYYWMPGKSAAQHAGTAFQGIPFKPGIRYYLGNFYAAGEAGLLLITSGGTRSSFAWSAGLGDKITWGSRTIDVGLRHEAWPGFFSRSGVIAARVAIELEVQRSRQTNRTSF
jgi:hypothetical protein